MINKTNPAKNKTPANIQNIGLQTPGAKLLINEITNPTISHTSPTPNSMHAITVGSSFAINPFSFFAIPKYYHYFTQQ